MTASALRFAAIAIAVAALVDPRLSVSRTRPLPVDVRVGPSPSDPDGSEAARVSQAFIARMGDDIALNAAHPRAVVAIGGSVDLDDLHDEVPVSVVSVEPHGRNVRVVDARATPVVIAGQRAIVSVVLEATGMRGETTVVALERDGVELARAAVPWTADQARGTVALACVAAEPGLTPLRVRAHVSSGERSEADNVMDVGLRAVDRALRVLAWAPRPSWTLTFVRRALESDAAFAVSSLTGSSHGVETRSGKPPASLTASALAPFDVAIVGAPEDLDRREVEALDAFVSDRGGAVVFLPDRLPAGPYRALVPAARFEEVLLDRPATVSAGDAEFHASEFALPAGGRAGGHSVAVLVQGAGTRPAVVAWPRGDGQVVFSGALDAWRSRGAAGEGFTVFWPALAAGLALMAPPPLSVSVDPPYAAPGDPVTVTARYRATELVQAADGVRVPAVRAEIVSSDGRATPFRLWPSSVPGEYNASVAAPRPGQFDLRVSGGRGLAADAPLLVVADARARRLAPAPEWLARATGGAVGHASDTTAVEADLRARPRPREPVDLYPMRSGWWIVPFAGALCAEWALRRRKGLR